MSSDFITALGILGVSALILHLKSHVKFITLGLFVGIVLAETVAIPLDNFLSENTNMFSRESMINTLQLLLLLLPTLILGFNHTVDKKRLTLAKTVAYSSVTTLLLIASILKYLPQNLQLAATDNSIIAWQLLNFHTWLLVLGAVIVVVDSFRHKRQSRSPST